MLAKVLRPEILEERLAFLEDERDAMRTENQLLQNKYSNLHAQYGHLVSVHDLAAEEAQEQRAEIQALAAQQKHDQAVLAREEPAGSEGAHPHLFHQRIRRSVIMGHHVHRPVQPTHKGFLIGYILRGRIFLEQRSVTRAAITIFEKIT